MIDVQAMANAAIQVVNPDLDIAWNQNAGYDTAQDGTRTPKITTCKVRGQIQALSARDLMHMDNLNIQGLMRKLYLRGDVQGVVRESQKGGDTITVPCGVHAGTWLVVHVLETWPTWSAVAICQQVTP